MGTEEPPEPWPFRFSRNPKPETRDTAIGWRAAQASANSEVFTKHESRDTNHGLYRRPVAAFLRDVARHGAAMARHGRPPSPAPSTRPVGFSRITKHESRDTAFTLFFPRFPTISRYFPVFPGPPTPPVKGLRAVRIGNTAGRVFTRHESRPLWPFSSPWMRRAEKKRSERWLNQKPKSAARQLLSCALWCGMGRLWCGMGGRRLPFRQHGLLGFHQPRDTQHGFSLSLRRLQGEQPQPRPTGFHESRDTNHE